VASDLSGPLALQGERGAVDATDVCGIRQSMLLLRAQLLSATAYPGAARTRQRDLLKCHGRRPLSSASCRSASGFGWDPAGGRDQASVGCCRSLPRRRERWKTAFGAVRGSRYFQTPREPVADDRGQQTREGRDERCRRMGDERQ
jgi:hypothetical protein